MTKMILRLHERFGVSLSLKDIFEASTIASLAARLESSAKEPSAVALGRGRRPMGGAGPARESPPPVTIGQERILRIEREIPGLLQFNMPLAYRLQGPLNVGALKRSLSEVVKRHEVLRTGFRWRRERPVAVITPAAMKSLPEDLEPREIHKTVLLIRAKVRAEQEWLTPIDLKQPPARSFCGSAETTFYSSSARNNDRYNRSLTEELVYSDRARSRNYPTHRFARRPQQRRWSAGEGKFALLTGARSREATPLFYNADAGDELTSQVAYERVHIPKVMRLRAASHKGCNAFMTLLAGFRAAWARTGRNDIVSRPIWPIAHRRVRSA
jgi:hypothetical protein